MTFIEENKQSLASAFYKLLRKFKPFLKKLESIVVNDSREIIQLTELVFGMGKMLDIQQEYRQRE